MKVKPSIAKFVVKSIGFAVATIVMSTIVGLPESAYALTGRDIMQKVNDRDDGDRSISEMEMILIDKNGKQRVRKIKTYGREQGQQTQSLMFFLTPADVKNTGFLTYDYDESGKDDDQWLYLPALRKTKRIASGDKSGSFMGTDLNYSDMTSPDIDLYKYTLMKETKVRGQKVWQIKSVPKTKAEVEKSGYSKSVIWIRQDNYMMTRAVRWVYNKKRNKYFDAKKIEKTDGIWIATELHVTTKSGKKTLHKTILLQKNIHFNQAEVNEGMFTVRRLEKGL
ncbi:MAG: outer membrane lipoprotein-sorting protein [Pirellulales bacterium]|nr:outer membrane lipoprotein-sorting protein [Pirellulales bacterium]